MEEEQFYNMLKSDRTIEIGGDGYCDPVLVWNKAIELAQYEYEKRDLLGSNDLFNPLYVKK
jgi:hypothetical protein